MTLFYYDPVFQEHRTGNHPENRHRLELALRHLQWTGMDACCRRPSWRAIDEKQMRLAHEPDYLRHLKSFCDRGGGQLDEDTVASQKSFEVARRASGAVCDAVRRVVQGEDRRALCLVRPPGHHALPNRAMGFCLLNNVALGARIATDQMEVDRVLIVDWDVHHGNGTQEVFWEDERVGFFSVHRRPFYPWTGAADEIGSGRGLGATKNLPIKYGTPRVDILQAVREELCKFAQRIRPQLVLISAGFDAHRLDPVGSLDLETEDFRTLTRLLLSLAAEYAEGRVVSVLEGGYNPAALTDCIEAHLEELLDFSTT